MKKLNGTITMKNVKATLNLNIGEISFKEESSRKDVKRNFKHNKAVDVKLSLDETVDEMIFDIQALNDIIKESGKQIVETVKEAAQPVEAPAVKQVDIERDKIKLCYNVLSEDRNQLSAKEARELLVKNFNYLDSQLDGRDVISLLRAECKHYLVREIQSR